MHLFWNKLLPWSWRRVIISKRQLKPAKSSSATISINRLFAGALPLGDYQYSHLFRRPVDFVNDSNIADAYPVRVLRYSKLLHVEDGSRYRIVLEGSVKSSVARGLGLLSSTLGITVVIGFPFIASPESPFTSETPSLLLAVNGRTSTAPSRL